MAILLWVGGVAALVAQMPQLGIAVWAVNLINGIFSFWQEFKAGKATEALRELLPFMCGSCGRAKSGASWLRNWSLATSCYSRKEIAFRPMHVWCRRPSFRRTNLL